MSATNGMDTAGAMKRMSTPQRAGLAVSRRPARSIAILLVMGVIFTAIVAQSGVRSTMAQVRESISRNVGAGFTATSDTGQVPVSLADTLAALPGISAHAFETMTQATPVGAAAVAAGGIQLDEGVESAVTLTGTTNSSLIPAFQGGIYSLQSGEHLAGDRPGALIHEAFAAQNNLTIGSELTLAQDGRGIRVPVTGIFSGIAENETGLPSGASENQVFTHLGAAQQLNGSEDVTLARFLVNDAESLPTTLAQARGTAPDLVVTDNAQQFAGVLAAVDSANQMLRLLLFGICLGGLGMAVLVLVFWVRGRIHEIGILLSIGCSKRELVGQFVLEASGLAAIATLLAMLAGNALSGQLGAFIISRVGDATLSSIGISSPQILSMVAGVGLGYLVVLAALAAALMPIITKTPKSILSQLS